MRVIGRDPFPLLKYENDGTFCGCKANQLLCHNLSTLDAQKQDPWNKLNRHHTLSSSRHQFDYFDSEASADDLDFRLKALYDQHRDWWKTNAEYLIQQETVGNSSRLLKNRPIPITAVKPPPEQPFKLWTSTRREHLANVSEAIDGHHSQATNGGYSRKPDGNKFTA
ncbi:hypothetical protein EG68_04969 [Paragonimus skrjabini miyazakii]|uniref:Uncharacterized protein n=1 Tax=Paragonimus skrjabini miyazakii TaxID=59628 RepID=A0A8S9YSG4_9TREM|nr:hypothetical protein EG68_04969 [Paragonimus skrjabini miyazakii]